LPDIDFAQAFIGLVVLLFALTVHESAHAWTAARLGDPTARALGRVSLNPLVHIDPIGTILLPLLAAATHLPPVAWGKPVPVEPGRLRHGRRDYVLVAAAGPASNLLLAVLSAIALAVLPVTPVNIGEPNISAPLAHLLSQALLVNLLLAVLNMIPIPPLDGGNVLGRLLSGRMARAFDRLRPYGFILLYALIFTHGFDYLVVPPVRLILHWLI
jgi:Zn-dependent protease